MLTFLTLVFGELADELIALVVDGSKRATAGAVTIDGVDGAYVDGGMVTSADEVCRSAPTPVVLLFGEFDSTAGKILSTTALLALFSLVALPAGVLIDQHD